MSFGLNQIKWDTVRKIAEKEVVVKTSISEMESGGAVKILDVLADGKLMSLDAQGDVVRVFGRVNFKLIYTDKENEIRGLDYFADFNESIATEGLSGKLFGKITVIDSDTQISSGINLSAVVSIAVFSVDEKTVDCLTAADESYYVETGCMKCQKFVTEVKSAITVSDDFDTKTDVMKVVMLDAKCYVDSVTAGNGNALVTGGVRASVTYLADDTVNIAEFDIPYSEELEDSLLAIGQKLSAEAKIKNASVVLTGIEGSNIIRVEIETELCVKAFETADNDIVTDIFSVTHELNEKRETAVCGTYSGFGFYKDEVSGEATLPDDMKEAVEVKGILSDRNSVAQAVAEEGKITIEGVFTATVLYRDEDGAASAELEIPYSIPFSAEVNAGDIVTAEGVVIKASARLKRGREIEVTATLGFMTEVLTENGCAFIAELTEGAEKEVNKSAVSVYIAEEGETVWDAAKALSAKPDDIKKQNPELPDTFKEGDKVFYYRQINFEF